MMFEALGTRFRSTATAIIAAVMIFMSAGPAGAAEEFRPDDVFSALAAELLEGITAKGDSTSTTGQGARIAIWPFEEDQIPVPTRLADSYNDSLLRALHKQAPERFLFLGRKDVAMTKQDYVRQMMADTQAAMALLEQEENILGYMAKLVALDALALSDEVMESELESGEGMPEDPGVTGAIQFFVNG